jgi:drug/metabolite transporter (DMT)-like permease
MALWAICYPLISLSLPHAPIMWTASLRSLIAGSVLVFIALQLKRPIPNEIKMYAHILAIGLTATSIGFWGMFYAGSLITPGLATVLTNTQPLIAGLLGWYFLDERMGKRALFGTLIGFAGIFVISAGSIFTADSRSLKGITYVVIAAMGMAVSNILLKKSAMKVDVLFAMGFQLLIGSIPLCLFAFFQASSSEVILNWDYVWILLLLALPGTALPFILWFWLMNLAPLYKLNVYNFLTPIFGIYFGYTFFSESLSLIQWLGVILVIGSVPLVYLSAEAQSTSRNVGAR